MLKYTGDYLYSFWILKIIITLFLLLFLWLLIYIAFLIYKDIELKWLIMLKP